MNIQEHVPLDDKTWFRTGGPARYFVEPSHVKEFQEALQFAANQQLPIFILGQGANILVSDHGFSGLVIRPSIKNIEIIPRADNQVLVCAGAGATMAEVILFCFDHNIIGLEEFSGIPGTIGGSVYMNLHYFQFLLAQFIVSAQVIHAITGAILLVDRDWFQFSYNWSRLHEQEYYLIDATFTLTRVDAIQTAFARGRHTEIIRYRTVRYPSTRTCGSFFRNFKQDEVQLEVNGKKAIWVAFYLDKIGIKGTMAVGDAMVSHQHANMIINRGRATSNDIIQLARLMQQHVYEAFGIIPHPECQFIGFESYPLLTS